jgi:hypothetical protein
VVAALVRAHGLVGDPLMFDRVTLHAFDPEASARFCDLVLGTLGIGRTGDGDGDGLTAWQDFAIAPATDVRPVTRRPQQDPDGNVVEIV